MSSVVGEVVDGEHPPGGAGPGLQRRCERLMDPIEGIIAEVDPPVAGADVVLVADGAYPFHPSTGLVTDPAVAGAVAAALQSIGAEHVGVTVTGSPQMSPERTMDLLGYDAVLETAGADRAVLDGGDDRRICHWRGVDERPRWFAVSTDLIDRPVVPVPTLRPTEDDTISGAVRTVAGAVDPGLPDVAAIPAADVVDPALAVLDATTAFASTPRCTGAVIAGPPLSVDVAGTRMLNWSVSDDPVLAEAADGEAGTVEWTDREGDVSLPTGQYPRDGRFDRIAAEAYRLYARVAGDAVPPQLDLR